MVSLGRAKVRDDRVILPPDVLDFLFLEEGDNIEFFEESGRIFLRRASRYDEGKDSGFPRRESFASEPPSIPSATELTDLIGSLAKSLGLPVNDIDPEMLKNALDTMTGEIGRFAQEFARQMSTPSSYEEDDYFDDDEFYDDRIIEEEKPEDGEETASKDKKKDDDKRFKIRID